MAELSAESGPECARSPHPPEQPQDEIIHQGELMFLPEEPEQAPGEAASSPSALRASRVKRLFRAGRISPFQAEEQVLLVPLCASVEEQDAKGCCKPQLPLH